MGVEGIQDSIKYGDGGKRGHFFITSSEEGRQRSGVIAYHRGDRATYSG